MLGLGVKESLRLRLDSRDSIFEIEVLRVAMIPEDLHGVEVFGEAMSPEDK